MSISRLKKSKKKDPHKFDIKKLQLIVIFSLLTLFLIKFAITTRAQQGQTLVYYTGCLQNIRGTLDEITTGASPLNPCRTGESQITWSNGDIISITTGAGLTGGGQSGDLTVSLADEGVTTSKIADNAVTAAKISNVTRIVTAVQNFVLLDSSGTTTLKYQFAIPYDYGGGDLTVREWYYVHDNTGTAKLSLYSWKAQSSGQVSQILSGTSNDFTASSLGDSTRTWTISSSSVNKGDVFEVYVQRQGDLSEDTVGRLEPRSIAIEYNADQ